MHNAPYAAYKQGLADCCHHSIVLGEALTPKAVFALAKYATNNSSFHNYRSSCQQQKPTFSKFSASELRNQVSVSSEATQQPKWTVLPSGRLNIAVHLHASNDSSVYSIQNCILRVLCCFDDGSIIALLPFLAQVNGGQ